MDQETEDIKAEMTKQVKPPKHKTKDMLSTGSALLNLAISGRPLGGLLKGTYILFIGDSDSGKTFLCSAILAEAANNPHFEDYKLIYDDTEGGNLIDIERFFGKKLAERIESPAGTKEEPVYSTTIEEFYAYSRRQFKTGPCVYILDSMDAVSSQDEQKKAEEMDKHLRKKQEVDEEGLSAGGKKGKKPAGSYGDAKAKKNASGIRQLLPHLREHGSILILINQTRDNIGFGYNEKTRSGGRAMVFYALAQIWSSIVRTLKKPINDRERQVGNLIKFEVKRSRLTGKRRSVQVPIYHSYGMDDVGSCVDFLLLEKHWKKSNGIINAKEFDFKGKRSELIKKIEDEELEKELRLLVGEVWQEIEEKLTLQRKPRYV